MIEIRPVCEVCGQIVPLDELTYDLMISRTRYGAEGEPVKTMIEPDVDKIIEDYIVVGVNCCGHIVEDMWNKLRVNLKNRR